MRKYQYKLYFVSWSHMHQAISLSVKVKEYYILQEYHNSNEE